MQGPRETDLASLKAVLLASQQKIIEFPISRCEKKFSDLIKKSNSRNKVISMRRKMMGCVSIAKKIDFFPFKHKKQSCVLLKEENLVFLITFRKNNFHYKFLQKFLYPWGVKVAHSIRMHWASNAPRYLKSPKRDFP